MNVVSYLWSSPWHGLRSAKGQRSWASSSSSLQFQNGVLFFQCPREGRKQSTPSPGSLGRVSESSPELDSQPTVSLQGPQERGSLQAVWRIWFLSRMILAKKMNRGIPSSFGKDMRRKRLLPPEFKQSPSKCETGPALYLLKTQESRCRQPFEEVTIQPLLSCFGWQFLMWWEALLLSNEERALARAQFKY